MLWCLRAFLTWVALLGVGAALSAPSARAHPWGGLVVDADGRVYFSFICPFVDDDHYACIWALDEDEQPYEVLRARRSPSDLVLARTPQRTIFAAERDGAEPNLRTRLWQQGAPAWSTAIPPTADPARLHLQAYAVADDGTTYFAREARLFARDTTGRVEPVAIDGVIERIDALNWGPGERLYLLDGGTLRIRAPDGTLTTRATGLKEETPENLPFAGANILFDIAVDDDGTAYIAYYGNRRVLRVRPSGEVDTYLQAEVPWSPHGVDVYEGDVYVLESTVGGGTWWKIWERPVIVPRVRKVACDGTVSTLFEHAPSR